MVRKEIIDQISEKTGLNKVIVKRVVDEFLKTLSDAFVRGERIELRNFGVFYLKRFKRKVGRNPKTGEEVIIPERDKIVFKPSKVFKNMGE